MNYTGDKREKSHIMKKREIDILVELIQQNEALTDYIDRAYRFDMVRIRLLQGILLDLENGRVKEAEYKIYSYGSQIGGQDLLERQMFLWLIGWKEEKGNKIKAE